ncbi:MAG: hypothetical protein ACRDBX_06300 [Erysipelotrichaceae bacterium]
MNYKELVGLQKQHGDQPFERLEQRKRIIEWMVTLKTQALLRMKTSEALGEVLSEFNYQQRHRFGSANDTGVWVRPGDICYIDFGNAYLNEVGNMHFGLILTIRHRKAFVLPLCSKGNVYKPHLVALGKVDGLAKESYVLLNDAKFINTARVIDVKGYLCPQSDQFKNIQTKLMQYLTQTV